MKERKEILSGSKGNNPFAVPEGYFDSLNQSILQKIGERTEVIKISESRRTRYIWTVAAAAVFAGALFFTYQLFFLPSVHKLTVDEIALVLEQDIYDLDESYFEGEIIESTLMDEKVQGTSYDDEVIQYLIDEGIDMESIVNAL